MSNLKLLSKTLRLKDIGRSGYPSATHPTWRVLVLIQRSLKWRQMTQIQCVGLTNGQKPDDCRYVVVRVPGDQPAQCTTYLSQEWQRSTLAAFTLTLNHQTA